MTDQWIIASTSATRGWKGRLVETTGVPQAVLPMLHDRLERFGGDVAAMTSFYLEEHLRWLTIGGAVDRCACHHHVIVPSATTLIHPRLASPQAEWAYVLTDDGITIYRDERGRHSHAPWTFVGFLTWKTKLTAGKLFALGNMRQLPFEPMRLG